MKIAVASDGLNVAQSFARCQNFNYYTTRSYEIAKMQNMPAQGLSAEEYAKLMASIGVDALITEDISDSAYDAFEKQGIQVVKHVHGSALEAASHYISVKADALDSDSEDDD